jgi:alpha-L-rhamnosidase
VGDTRLEALIAYSVSGDPRLPVQAIDAFGESQRADGLTESAYPSSGKNIIPPFSLMWIDMMHDYWMHQSDSAVLRRNLPGARRVFKWYAQYVTPNGLLRRNPDWNFIDWVGTPPLARNKFPSFDPASGTSCLTSLVYLGALKDAAELESALGDPTIAGDDRTKASALQSAIQNACWNQQRGLYGDDPSMTVFSQHANALAVLYDVASREKAPEILRKISSDHGIDAPDGVLTTSYYFSWYLVRAYEHAGLADRYFHLLETWRDLLKLHYTTWPEERGNTRSDTHAWSAHPTDDLLGIVAGVQPASPGYATVRVAPNLGRLNHLRATAMTPAGPVSVMYSRIQKGAILQVNLPERLTGTFFWNGADRHLHSGLNKFKFNGPASAGTLGDGQR